MDLRRHSVLGVYSGFTQAGFSLVLLISYASRFETHIGNIKNIKTAASESN
jgi:hypothetical protein